MGPLLFSTSGRGASIDDADGRESIVRTCDRVPRVKAPMGSASGRERRRAGQNRGTAVGGGGQRGARERANKEARPSCAPLLFWDWQGHEDPPTIRTVVVVRLAIAGQRVARVVPRQQRAPCAGQA